MKSRHSVGLATSIVAITVLLIGCTHLGKKSPPEVLQAFFAAANSGKYSEAEGYLTSSSKSMMALGGGIKKFADKETRDGTLASVEILKIDMRGEGAKINYKIHYKDGQSKDDDVSLIVENGEWRIDG